ncbi:hypothetical protein BC332_20228 [Capsicum chinense]|nr:hypothetical protein BC332_20228 [Capsicum chinense]
MRCYNKVLKFINLRKGDMTVKEYSLKFIQLSRYAPHMVVDSRAKISKFVSGVNNSVVSEYSSTMLNSDITLAWLMTHAQQIEEQMIKMRERQNKRARTASAPLPKTRNDHHYGCQAPMPRDGLTSVDNMAIYGMGVGGVGKSTLAKTAYNFNFNKYDGSSFLADENKTSERHDGLVCLQRQLFSNVLGKKAENIYNVDDGVIKIQEAIQCRIILLVLEDVDDSDHLNAVLGMREGFIQNQFDSSADIITRECAHRYTVKPIWGPPGTRKMKTVASLLYVMLKIRCRTLTCAPTNVAVLEVTKKLMQNAQSRLQYDNCGLGDIVLFCNRERMKIGDHEDLFDLFLNNRVDVFASFLSPNNG